jgi:hypothetical protein
LSFLYEDKPYDVPCVFQIWIKKDYKRQMKICQEPKYFIFTNKDNGEIAIRRVGIKAGKISYEITDKNPNTHYFIKFNCKYDKNLFNDFYTKIEFEKNNTVGARSISKQELIEKLNEFTL